MKAARGPYGANADTLTQTLRYSRRAASHQADDRRNGEQHDCDEEHDLGGFNRHTRDTTEPEDGGDQGDDEKRHGPTQHVDPHSVVTIVRGKTRTLSNSSGGRAFGALSVSKNKTISAAYSARKPAIMGTCSIVSSFTRSVGSMRPWHRGRIGRAI